MTVFQKDEDNSWVSHPQAGGPFRGLQGGGLAALMVTELERIADNENLGMATSVSIEFLRPTGTGSLRTNPHRLRIGRRVSILTNEIFENDVQTARSTVFFIASSDLQGLKAPPSETHDPAALPLLPPRKAPHGGPWMMDNFEVRLSPEGIVWFRFSGEIVSDITPLARVLVPADWTHGLGRPASPKMADPNVNIQMSLSRHPEGEFIGILPRTRWMPSGIGMGEGEIFDVSGACGRVMMSVALTPFE